MSYSLTLERPDNPISTAEWSEAVGTQKVIRLTSGDIHTTQNPKTGETIGIKAVGGDAEVYLEDYEDWVPAILWRDSNGAATFRIDIVERAVISKDISDPVWAALISIAKQLSAQIRGEEGEVYDLDTGESTMK